MKKIIAYSVVLLALLSCSKDISKEGEIPAESQIEGNSSTTNLLPPDESEENKKKYASKICYIENDPTKVGTICEDPGDKCKKYDCTLSAANRTATPLSESEINKYATMDAEYLLNKGLIEKQDFEYFKNFSKNSLVKRNKSLPFK